MSSFFEDLVMETMKEEKVITITHNCEIDKDLIREIMFYHVYPLDKVVFINKAPQNDQDSEKTVKAC